MKEEKVKDKSVVIVFLSFPLGMVCKYIASWCSLYSSLTDLKAEMLIASLEKIWLFSCLEIELKINDYSIQNSINLLTLKQFSPGT